MFTFDYRQQLMARIAASCGERIGLCLEGQSLDDSNAQNSYLYMVSADAFEFVQQLAPGTVPICPSPADGSRYTAGELYRTLYLAATGRTARVRDCRRLDSIQRTLMDAIKDGT